MPAALLAVYARAFQELGAGCDPPDVTDWLLTLAEEQFQALSGQGLRESDGIYAKLKN